MLSRLLLPFLALLLLPVSTYGQTSYYFPDIQNSRGVNFQDFPLGVLSATGRLFDGEAAILVKDVSKTGIAGKAGLQIGDRIFKVQGKTLGRFSMNPDAGLAGPQALLATQLYQTSIRDKRNLRVTVIRSGKLEQLDMELPPCLRYDKRSPGSGEMGEHYLQGVCRMLVRLQQKDGMWKSDAGLEADQYLTALCGLTLLSSGDPGYLPAIRKSVVFLVRSANNPQPIDVSSGKGPNNWVLSTMAIFLAEYHLATGDKLVLPHLSQYCNLLARRISPEGKIARGAMTSPKGGVCMINAHAHLAWALAEKCGNEINENAWMRSLNEVTKATTQSGAIGFSSDNRKLFGAAGRTGCMTSALLISGSADQRRITSHLNWLARYNNQVRDCYLVCSMGMIYSTSALKLGSKAGYQRHMRNWFPYLELCRAEHNYAQYFGSKKNFVGDIQLGLQPTGNAIVGLMLASAQDNLFLFGGKDKNWLTGKSSSK